MRTWTSNILTTAARGLAALVVASTIGCRATAGEKLLIVHAEGANTKSKLLARSLGERRGVNWGFGHRLIQLCEMNSPSDLRGCPVFSPAGQLVGMIDARYGRGTSRVFGVLPVAALQEGWRRGRAASRTCYQEPDLPATSVAPGSSIRILFVWGDVRLGLEGTLVERRGHEVLCYTRDDNDLARLAPEPGPGPYQLQTAPVVGVGEQNAGLRRILAEGQTIGTITYIGVFGAYGRLGARIDDYTRVDLKFENPGRRPASFAVAANARSRQWTKLALQVLLGSRIDPLACVDVKWQVSDGTVQEAEIVGDVKTPSYRAVAGAVMQTETAVERGQVIAITLNVRSAKTIDRR